MGRSTRGSAARKLAWIAAGGLLAMAAFGAGAGPVAAANGSIWTTGIGCATPDVPQDQNQYVTGDTVTIRGLNFDPNTLYSWSITGQKGGASADPGITVASGTVTSDGTGYFCVDAYVIPPDDEGTYSVDAGDKNDNYSVDGADSSPAPSPTPTPTPGATPTPTPDPSASAGPSGGTGSGTGGPTTPPTDTAARPGDDQGSLGIVLLLLATALGAALVLTPEHARRR